MLREARADGGSIWAAIRRPLSSYRIIGCARCSSSLSATLAILFLCAGRLRLLALLLIVHLLTAAALLLFVLLVLIIALAVQRKHGVVFIAQAVGVVRVNNGIAHAEVTADWVRVLVRALYAERSHIVVIVAARCSLCCPRNIAVLPVPTP